MDAKKFVPAVQVRMAHNGISKKANEFGMLPMQERAYNMRGEQYLLIKSPPASGKSRALMFIALDKLYNQGIKKAIICVPERSIGGSFANQPLSQYGFFADWVVEPRWNLCNASGSETSTSKVRAVGEFLKSEDKILICTHATFRFAFESEGVAAFDNCMIAIDEFHHVSADSENNRLGAQLRELIARDSAHLVAMTGSYFRGDSVPVLSPEDEERFASVTYTYYEQLNGYEYLKELDLGYYFYTNGYLDAIMDVLNPDEKTIVHIPNVNSRESTKRGKNTEVEDILTALGTWLGVDEKTGFQLVKRPDGRILKIADLVDDDPLKRNLVVSSLKNPEQTNNRDYVDIIIALGMAKEGFDWIWCEHALTVGYRSSLTEVVQIIGRATRDAPGKSKARFTNLIAQPDAADEQVHEAVNDTIKAIALSLLMEQVLAPRFNFTAKQKGPIEGFDYGEDGYSTDKPNVGFNESSGQFHIELNGLIEPKSPEAKRIVAEDLNELIADFVADKTAIGQGLFNNDIIPEELTIGRMGKIVKDRYPNEDPEDQEAIRQAAIAAFNLVQQSKKHIAEQTGAANDLPANTAFVDGVRKYVLDVRNLDIDLIDHINPFEEAYAILSKTMNEKTLKTVSEIVAAKKINLTYDDARALAERALKFKEERGRLPSITAQDPWEKRMAEGVAWLARNKAKS